MRAADDRRTDGGRIVGWGLTLNPPHRFTVYGHRLYAWCAADTLAFPAIIEQRALVESPCPTTRTTVRLTVVPATGVADLEPASAVISISRSRRAGPQPGARHGLQPWSLFASPDAASDWLTQHPTGRVLPVAAAYDQFRPILNRLLANGE
ncbi:Alkylmercury lyase [Mycobacterium innocens]|uniref:Alkylmercury lyase n=1 Tax=Mycobacterium innocens TaxID=2341083 RepID=A0A498Q4F0_9MYCO|nr:MULTISPECIES: organomercurial lyase [Mycobacterium]VBA39402.1 Alkylmercury lyase [Mycobacterium innocens]